MFTTSASGAVSRRGFLRQNSAFSALTALGSFSPLADALAADRAAAHLLMLGAWGDENPPAQSTVTAGMRQYSKEHALLPQGLLLLGDNWYGDLSGGVRSPRWQTQFEEMYPPDAFSCPAYSIAGNHDYQIWPESKVAAELEYACWPHQCNQTGGRTYETLGVIPVSREVVMNCGKWRIKTEREGKSDESQPQICFGPTALL